VLAALFMAGVACAQGTPILTGMWRLQGDFSPELKTIEGEAPPLLPQAEALYRQRQAAYRSGDRSFDPAATICVSPGMPRMAFLAYPFQIIQRPHQLVFLFEWNGRHRVIDLSGAPLTVPDLFYMGSAAGHVEGDTLVIETQGLTPVSLLDANGLPHSEQLRLTERYRLNGSNTLINEMTLEDPQTFSRPWKTRVTYKRLPRGTELQEDVCRDRVPKGGPAFEDKWK
jgi:hypothetical protein